MIKYPILILLFCYCACSDDKRKFIFTGRIFEKDQISIVENKSGVVLTKKVLPTFSNDVVLLDEERELSFKTEKVLHIKIDSSGIIKLDTVLCIPDSIKQPNVLFEVLTSSNYARRVLLRDYIHVKKY